jgi:hypothetical protein
MPLPLPDLDDRTWSDLVDEATSLIHRYAPGWTDYNLSDPGITLIDLLAWITEADVYGVDQVPPRHRQRFLALAGVPLRRVVAARTPLAFTAGAPVVLPAGVVFAASADTAAPVAHRLSHQVEVLGCALTAVQVWNGSAFVDRTQDWQHAAPFDALGPDPGVGAALMLGLDPAPALDPAARLSIWLALDDAAGSAPDHSSPRPHHSAQTVWEFHDGTTWVGFAGEVTDDTRSLTGSGQVVVPLGELRVAASTLGAVTQPRRWVRVRLARGRHDVAPRVSRILVDAALVVQTAPAYATWQYADPSYQPPSAFAEGATASFGVTTDPLGRILAFEGPAGPDDPHALLLELAPGSITMTLVGAGIADGAPSFQTTVGGAPFTGDHTEVWTADASGNTRWTVVESLLRSGPGQHHVVFDPATGTLCFGDGEHGRIPTAGATVLVRADQTRGVDGTPTPRTAWRLDTANPLTAALTQSAAINAADLLVLAAPPFAARPADDLEAGEGRAADAVRSHERLIGLAPPGGAPTLDQLDRGQVLARSRPARAATTLDFERLALDVPGTAVLRAKAWTGLDPAQPWAAAPGTVTVVIVPGLPAQRPLPTQALLTQVRRYLCPRRTLGTRLIVTAPDYIEVSVRAVLQALPHADTARVQADALAQLYTFLHPLTGGPAGRGWPFGRDVFQSEVLRQLDLIGGVDHVVDIELTADGVAAGCGNITVAAVSLVVSGTHEVIVQ